MYSDEIVTSLKHYITEDEVFGPKDASLIKDNEVISVLFDAHNKIYSEMQKKPSIIIGRKGAGKTSFLKCTTLDADYSIIIELKTWKVFSNIVDTIENMSSKLIFVESLSELWDAVFWTAIISELAKSKIGSTESNHIFNKFMDGAGLNHEMTSDEIMSNIVEVLKESYKNNTVGIIKDLFDMLKYENIPFNKVKETAIKTMQQQSIKAVILMDSIEEYHLEVKNVSHAISGLLKCLGSFHVPGHPNEVRCCLPAELYHSFIDLSSHPIKDFQSHVTLHWHAGELLQVAASRLRLFFQLYDNDYYNTIKNLKLEQREDCKIMFNKVLPPTITNRLGGVEDPIAYILRHTQLNPRHLIHILNSICYKNKRDGNNPSKISEDAIREGVLHVEESICKEVYRAYKSVYPDAEKVLKRCLPHLPLKFTGGELHKIFNMHGKKYFYSDFEDFKRMLIEIGAVGRVIDETERYVIGLFEYTQPHQLVVSSYEQLCLHPLFTEIYVNRTNGKTKNIKPVYPYGTDIEGKDHRPWR